MASSYTSRQFTLKSPNVPCIIIIIIIIIINHRNWCCNYCVYHIQIPRRRKRTGEKAERTRENLYVVICVLILSFFSELFKMSTNLLILFDLIHFP